MVRANCGVRLLLALALTSSIASATTWPSGEVINPGVTIDITEGGFDAVADLVPSLLPSAIPIGTVGDGYAGILDQCWLGGYEYELSNGQVAIEVTSVDISPGSGVLDIDAVLMVSVNTPSDPFDLYFSLECLEDTCAGYVDPFPVDVHTSMRLSIVTADDGTRTLDATMGEIDVTYELDGASDIMLSGCTIGDIEEVLNYVGISLYDLLIGALDSTLQSQIADLGPTLEEAIEDAFASATIEQDLELNGASVHILLQPSNVDITPASVRLWMEGAFEAEPAACVAAYDPGGSPRTDSTLPDPDQVPSGVGKDYHLGVMVGDDFANSALYAFWRGGLLCYELDAASSPIPLDTSLLNILTGDAFAPLFGDENKPVTLSTRPVAPPEVSYSGAYDIGVSIKDLNLDFFAELDGRSARMISIELDGEVGADLALDSGTGSLAIDLALAPENFTPSVSYNEIEPDANSTVTEKFSGLFGTILDSVVGGLISDLAFALPSISGVGLKELEIGANGSEKDWLGIYASLGPVSYSGGDCGGCGGGCGGVDTGGSTGTDCAGGCATVPTAPWVAIAATVLWMRRRRQG
jgi:hypothetical protein